MFGGDLRYLPPSMPGNPPTVAPSQFPFREPSQGNSSGGRGRAGRADGRPGSPEQERVYGSDSTGRGISPEHPAGSPCGHRTHSAGHDHAGHDHQRDCAGHQSRGSNGPYPAELRVHLQRRRQADARGGQRPRVPRQAVRPAPAGGERAEADLQRLIGLPDTMSRCAHGIMQRKAV